MTIQTRPAESENVKRERSRFADMKTPKRDRDLLDSLRRAPFAILLVITLAAQFAQSQPPAPRPTQSANQNKSEGQNKDDSGKTKKSQTAQIVPAVNGPSAQVATQSEQKANTEEQTQSFSGWVLKWGNLLAACASAVAALATVGLIAFQSHVMHKQREAMDKQSCLLESSLAETKKAADAALSQVNLTIAKERARLSIFIAHTPDLGQFATPESVFVRLEIGNDGASKAFDVEVSVECFTGADRPIVIPNRPYHHFIGIIERSESIVAERVLPCPQDEFEKVKIGAIKLRLHTVVSYINIFNQRKTFANKFVFCPFPTASEPQLDWALTDATVIVPEQTTT